MVMVVMTVLLIGVGGDCDKNDDGDDYGDESHLHMYDDGDVDDGASFFVSWHRCNDLISLYLHAPSCLILWVSRSKALSTCLKQPGQLR